MGFGFAEADVAGSPHADSLVFNRSASSRAPRTAGNTPPRTAGWHAAGHTVRAPYATVSGSASIPPTQRHPPAQADVRSYLSAPTGSAAATVYPVAPSDMSRYMSSPASFGWPLVPGSTSSVPLLSSSASPSAYSGASSFIPFAPFPPSSYGLSYDTNYGPGFVSGPGSYSSTPISAASFPVVYSGYAGPTPYLGPTSYLGPTPYLAPTIYQGAGAAHAAPGFVASGALHTGTAFPTTAEAGEPAYYYYPT